MNRLPLDTNTNKLTSGFLFPFATAPPPHSSTCTITSHASPPLAPRRSERRLVSPSSLSSDTKRFFPPFRFPSARFVIRLVSVFCIISHIVFFYSNPHMSSLPLICLCPVHSLPLLLARSLSPVHRVFSHSTPSEAADPEPANLPSSTRHHQGSAELPK